MWSVLAYLHPIESNNNPQRVSKYEQYEKDLNFNGIDFPVKIEQISHFEKQNNISINCYCYDNGIYPIYISTKTDKRTNINLMYITNEDGNSHYCYIKDFNRLNFSYNKHKDKKHFCMYCLHGFSSQKLLDKHTDCFAINGIQKITLPTKNKDDIRKFINYKKQLKVPFVIYADFEALTTPIQTTRQHDKKNFIYQSISTTYSLWLLL
jgi:hypothetical protein